jgi:hypothetical protein
MSTTQPETHYICECCYALLSGCDCGCEEQETCLENIIDGIEFVDVVDDEPHFGNTCFACADRALAGNRYDAIYHFN